MKMWQKGWALVLSGILLLGGCAGNSEPVDAPVNTTTTTRSGTTLKAASVSSDATTTGIGDASGTTADKVPTKTTTTTADRPTGNQKPTTTATRTTTARPSVSTSRIVGPPYLRPGTIKVAGMAGCCFDLDENANVWNKRIVEELAFVEKSLNCQFKLSLYDSASLTEQCIKADKAGSKFCDILVTNVWQQRSLVKARALANLNEVEGLLGKLNLTHSWWDQSARKSMELYGKNFIAFTQVGGTAYNANVIYFNKVLAKSALQKLGYTVDTPEVAGKILYKTVDDGKWTFDLMQKLSQKAAADLNGDGKMDDKTAKDQYGFTGVNIRNSAAYSIFKARDGYFTKKSSDGSLVYALDDAINITALKTMQTWLLKDSSIFNPDKYGNNAELGAETFLYGRALFLGWSADKADYFASMKDDWGVLPYPKYNNESTYAGAVDWNMQGFSIPRKVKGDDLTRAVEAIDGIARCFEDLAEEKEAYLQKRVFRDTDCLRMLQLAASTATVDPVQFADLGAGGMSTIHYLFDKVSSDPAQRVKSVHNDAVKALNDFLKAVK